MKIVWMSAFALALAACAGPAERPRKEKSAPTGEMSKAGANDKMAKQIKTEKKVVKKANVMPASKIAGVSATALATAIQTALAKVPGGEALSAEIEIENGKALIDVKIFSHGKVWEVEVDGATGVVLEVEQEDDDDDDDDDEDDDGDEDDD